MILLLRLRSFSSQLISPCSVIEKKIEPSICLSIFITDRHILEEIEDRIRSSEHAKRNKYEYIVIIVYKNVGHIKEFPVN
jgi:hypothetical protein